MQKSLLSLIVCFIICVQSSAQNAEQSKIIHFERKLSLDSIPLVGSKFSSEIFNIIYPDSLYNEGKIRIKKASFQDMKFEFNSEFKNHIYTFTSFKSNKKNQKKLIQIIKKHFHLDELSKNQITLVKIDNNEYKIMAIKKHIYITLKE